MSVVTSLKKFLEEKEFERYKGSCSYFKRFGNGYYAIAEVYRDRQHFIYNKAENCFYDANGPFYDIHVDIWHEALKNVFSEKENLTNFNAGNSLCRLSNTSELQWIKIDISEDNRIVKEIESAFIKFFYEPLFCENGTDIYDYLCKLDIIRNNMVIFNSPLLLAAALNEKRYTEAMFCLKCNLIYYTPLENKIKGHKWSELVDLLTDEMIECLRDNDNPYVKSLIEQYDNIVELLN